TAAYLTTQVRCQANPPVLWLPRLLWWFQGDFGGRPGIARLLAQHGLPPPSDARWRYQPYSWDLHLGQFT
ncbi:MAG: hypothetical protein MUC97_01115, partial [Bernardetiaceae bacterium]|nr:hypothetical protein [Bernardetiaceae bacterium]